ncbi:MAG: TonB-dependent receptor [Pseudomonadota bacterium]
MIYKTNYFVLFSCLLLLMFQLSIADDIITNDDTENVIRVTAEKFTQPIQTVNASISIVDEQLIQDASISNINELARQVPGLQIYGEGSGGRSTYIFLRGIGAAVNEPAIGFYVDGVPYLRESLFDLDLTGVEQVEILRGPQGSLYGRNALGGIINVVTRQPDTIADATVSATLGSFNNKTITSTLSVPLLSDTLSLSLGGKLQTSDGFTKNDISNNYVNAIDSQSGRAALYIHPGNDLSVILRIDAHHTDNGAWSLNPVPLVEAKPHHVLLNTDGYNKKQDQGYSATIEATTELFKITSISALRNWDNQVHADLDYSPIDIVRNYLNEQQSALSQEIRFSSLEQYPWRWMLGFFYSNEDFEKDLTLNYRQGAVDAGLIPSLLDSHSISNFKNKNYAIFTQITAPLGLLELTFGLRYEHETKKINHQQGYYNNQILIPATTLTRQYDLSESYWLPKLSIAYDINKNNRIYASTGTGFRSGGFNYTQNIEANAVYKSEKALNFELGNKGKTSQLRWQFALFYTHLKDQQLARWTDGFLQYIENVGTAFSRGFEAELQWNLNQNWSLLSGYNYTDARYINFQDANQNIDYSDNRLPFVPKQNFNFALQQQQFIYSDTLWINRLELQTSGDIFWNENNQLKQPIYHLVNGRMELEADNWRIALWAKNLFDKKFQAAGLVDPRLGSRVLLGAPRSFGINLAVLF